MAIGPDYWVKILPVAALGSLAFALLEASEFARQDYELAVCTNGSDQCQFSSANSGMLSEASVAVAAMIVSAVLANIFAPPTLAHMKAAFVPFHFFSVVIWYFSAWALTLVPFIYTCFLLYQQANHLAPNLYAPDQAVNNQSPLLAGLATCDDDGNCTPYNPCNPNSIYCLSIQPGMLAGFGYLFAGATAFWTAWLVMDDTALKILRNEDVDGGDGAMGYFSSVPEPEPHQPSGDATHISQMR